MLDRHTKALPDELIPSAKDAETHPSYWIYSTGSIEALIGYLDLVWRDFVLHDGCLLSAGFSIENYDNWMRSTNGNQTAVEAVMNHEHIMDMFERHEPEPTHAQILVIGRVLREMWTAKLAKEFPGLSITVSFPDDKQYEDLLDYRITVYQNR